MYIPAIHGNTEQGDFGGFSAFHRVSNETGHRIGSLSVQTISGSHQKVVTAVIAYREVPPDIGGTADTLVDPFKTFQGNIVYNTIPGPHDMDSRVKLFAQDIEIIGPCP